MSSIAELRESVLPGTHSEATYSTSRRTAFHSAFHPPISGDLAFWHEAERRCERVTVVASDVRGWNEAGLGSRWPTARRLPESGGLRRVRCI